MLKCSKVVLLWIVNKPAHLNFVEGTNILIQGVAENLMVALFGEIISLYINTEQQNSTLTRQARNVSLF